MGPCDLQAVLDSLPRSSRTFARLLETKDDAAVVPLTHDLSLVQTVDFFTPIVDDPLWFGRIAAANALSDVYAMGARPLSAMNLVAWPAHLGREPLVEILRGGLEKVEEAGAELAGGHSIEDLEPKYGLAVTGLAHPEELVWNVGARAGDRLVLTKRLGIGVLASALKKGLIAETDMMGAIREAAALNDVAARAMLETGVHACTDVSGFGLLGHLIEMLQASSAAGGDKDASGGPRGAWSEGAGSGSGARGPRADAAGAVGARLSLSSLPLQDLVLRFIEEGVYAGGLRTNRDYFGKRLVGGAADDPRVLSLFDPQTSGGLLIAVPAERHEALLAAFRGRGAAAWTIGEITADAGSTVHVSDGTD